MNKNIPEYLSSTVSKIPTELLHFVDDSTKHFDDSHDVIHALKVTSNALAILQELEANFNSNSHSNSNLDSYTDLELGQSVCAIMPEQLDSNLLIAMTMLHDVCDHKYPESIQKSQLEEFIINKYGEENGTNIIDIIDNVSYSKEVKGLTKNFPFPLNLYLSVVADADRLEAIGREGIERCEIFTSTHGGKVPEDVIKHCHEKLLRLLSENFIKTGPGKKMAEPLHREIEEYVRFQEEQLKKFN